MMDIRSPLDSLTVRLLALVFLCSVPLAVVALIYADASQGGFVAVLVCIAVAVAGSLLVARGLASSLDRFARFCERLAAGHLGARVYPSRILQLGRLAHALNAMARSLAERMDALAEISSEQDAILRSMVEGVITINRDGKIQRVNKAACSLLSIDEESSKGRLVSDVIHHIELQRFIETALSSQETRSDVVTVVGDDERVFGANSSALLTEQGVFVGTLVVLHDITRIQKLEKIRKDFVANVSHELRTPITSIKGFVETLLDGAMHDPESLQKFLGIIGRHSERLNAILSDLLMLARLEVSGENQIEVASLKLRDIAQDAFETCSSKADSKGISVSVDVSENERIMGNASLVEQALVNLIDNAIKYSDSGDRVLVRCETADEMCRVMVTDSGPGIDKSHLSRLFERFYRIDQGRSRQMGGTGLGLAIVKHIVQLHGGRIEVESTLGEGSTFSMYFKRG
jgi:two-component system phosphate regulon sensor histidine kinase PhoR